MDKSTEDIILKELQYLREQLDGVRANDIPAVKTDVALLVQTKQLAGILVSMVGSVAAVIVSVLVSLFIK